MLPKITIMMSIIAIINIILYESETRSHFPNEILPPIPIIVHLCPMQVTEEYQVTVMNANSLGGCAFIDNKSSGDDRKSLSIWIGKLLHGKPQCRVQGMDHYRFSCQMDYFSDIDQMIVGNYSFTHGEIEGRLTADEHRFNWLCANYEMYQDNRSDFKMVISEDFKCDNLSELLSQPSLKMPGKTMLLQLNRTSEINKTYQMRTTTQSTINSNNTIKN